MCPSSTTGQAVFLGLDTFGDVTRRRTRRAAPPCVGAAQRRRRRIYRRALAELHPGQPALPIGVHSPGFVFDTDEEAREILFPHFKQNCDRIGRERGWLPSSMADIAREADSGALVVGSPVTVALKIAATVKALGARRFDLTYSNGPLPHEHLMRCIELYGTEVAPRVRELLPG